MFLCQSLVGTFFTSWFLRRRFEAGWTETEYGMAMSVLGLARLVVNTTAWVLLLVALYGWRSRRPAERRPGRYDLDESEIPRVRPVEGPPDAIRPAD